MAFLTIGASSTTSSVARIAMTELCCSNPPRNISLANRNVMV